MLISTGESSDASIANSIGTNTWAFAAGNKFGVTTDGTLYTLSAKINNAAITNGTITTTAIENCTISSKLEVKKDNNTIFLADADPKSTTNGDVQIGDFKVQSDPEGINELKVRSNLYANDNASTTLKAGELIIQSRPNNTSIDNSTTWNSSYYAGISSDRVIVSKNSNGTLKNTPPLGLFGNVINRVYPKWLYHNSDSMWSYSNLKAFPVCGTVFLTPNLASRNGQDVTTATYYDDTFNTWANRANKTSGLYIDFHGNKRKRLPNLVIVMNITALWSSSDSTSNDEYHKVLDLRNLGLFRSQFGNDSLSWEPVWADTPALLNVQITPNDCSSSILLTCAAIGEDNIDTTQNAPAFDFQYIWSTYYNHPRLDYGQIGLIIGADNNLKVGDKFVRHFTLTVYIDYPYFGATS